MEEIIAIEFFSGIGGLHYGLDLVHPTAKVVAAFDTNTNANRVYLHNFQVKPSAKGIERITAEYLDKFKANFWLLSPPCQPYTQGGKRLDHEDARAAGLLNLIKIMPEMKVLPKYIFVENVPNFEVSESRDRLVKTLGSLGYVIDEFLVSPVLVGIPNDRRRYYLAGRLDRLNKNKELKAIHTHLDTFINGYKVPELKPLAEYLESNVGEEYDVPPTFIRKRTNFEFDVVQSTSLKTSTFTKSYGSHHFFGSGSMLQTLKPEEPYNTVDNELLISLKPRFFTALEIARLHAFPAIEDKETGVTVPHYLEFPEDITLQQKWKLLGNSLNVKIISVILEQLLKSGAPTELIETEDEQEERATKKIRLE